MRLKAKQIIGLDSLNYIPKSGNTSTTIANSLYATTISGGTLYGDGSNLTGINDFYVTGGTFSGTTLTLDRQNGSVVITGFTSTSVDTYVTGFTYSNNNITLLQNQNQTPLNVNISTMTGLTVNGNTNINYLTLTDSTVSYTSLNQTNGTIFFAPKGAGTVDMSTARITSLANPVDTYDGANKFYVDYTVKSASLALSISVPIGYTDNQICLNYLTKVFPPAEHENLTNARVVVTQGGSDTIRLYTLSSGNWTGGSLL